MVSYPRPEDCVRGGGEGGGERDGSGGVDAEPQVQQQQVEEDAEVGDLPGSFQNLANRGHDSGRADVGGEASGDQTDPEPDYVCSECDKKTPPGSSISFEWILCSKCVLWFHEYCVGVMVKDYEEDREWLCSMCSSSTVSCSLSLAQIEAVPSQERLFMLGEKSFL